MTTTGFTRRRPTSPARKRAGTAVVITVTAVAVALHGSVQPVAAAPGVRAAAPLSLPTSDTGGASNPEVAWYAVNSSDNPPTLKNSIANGPAATLSNGPTLVDDSPWITSNTERSIVLDGVDDYAAGPATVSTTAAFTVSAWAKVDRADRAGVVFSQDGVRRSAYELRLDGSGKWQFAVPRADTDSAAVDVVTGPAAVAGTWTHLAGVFDDGAKQLTLYVNGKRVGSAAHTATWAATGGLVFGRGRAAGASTGFLAGRIDELRARRAAASDFDVCQLVVLPEQARQDRCEIGHWLHAGGPEVKAVAGQSLESGDYGRREVTYHPGGVYGNALDSARRRDSDAYIAAYQATWDQHTAWEAVIQPYDVYGGDFSTFHQAPQYATAFHRFLLDRNSDDSMFRVPAPAKPAQAELDRALAIAADMRVADPWFAPSESFVRTWSAGRVARFLRFGGYPTQTPAPDTLEFRTEVESVKLLWAGCETDDPDGMWTVGWNRDPGPLAQVVTSAWAEWDAELAAQSAQRADVVAAETQATKDLRTASEALIEAQGEAWIVGQLFKWQKYWAGRPASDVHYPSAAQFTQVRGLITTAQNKIAQQLTVARDASTSAKAQTAKATTALTQAAAIATASRTPIYRGLAYARQSAQVTKASAAAAESASKAIETTLNAARATSADGTALQSLALTQQSALQAEFRRVAAQEAAAQAKAAAEAAALQAADAVKAAQRAKADRATAEQAETAAQASTAEAQKQLAIAQQERDKAAAARQRADAERAKAGTAEAQAQRDQSTAAGARSSAESKADLAVRKAGEADQAEWEASQARDRALTAESERNGTASRAAALEAQAAAASGRSDAGEARTAATEARTAANQAAGAASSARAAATQAEAAAVAARAAAVEANAAAWQSRSAADKAEAAMMVTREAWLTARAATADALAAAAEAARSAERAQGEADKAAAGAATARSNAQDARAQADTASAESARTAGAAYAAGEAAAAARDSALAAVAAATEAMAIGAPFAATDASAGMAVLVGQSAKTIAQQQAESAEIRADEAAAAAAAAKTLADRAQADAKAAADAAAAAAADAAAAAQSVLLARGAAEAAAADAKATEEVFARIAQLDLQAQLATLNAQIAAGQAEAEARLADEAASDAERDAASARAAATQATADARHAGTAAGRAETAAADAEESAANAQGYAQAAQDAAKSAEAKQAEDDWARWAEYVTNGPNRFSPLSREDELILLMACGQVCVDDYKKAVADGNLDILQFVQENGGEILLDMIGWNDAKACFTEGDVEGCLWTAVTVVATVIAIGKIPAVSKAIYRISAGIYGIRRAAEAARRIIARYDEIIAKFKRSPEPPTPTSKPGKGVDPQEGVRVPAHRQSPYLGSDGRYYPKEGDTNIEIFNVGDNGEPDFGRTYTDIDRIDGGVLWEEKTAVNPRILEGLNIPYWINDQLFGKVEKYAKSRSKIAGYENAPIGIRFTDPNVPRELREAVEQVLPQLRAKYPNIEIRVEFA